MGLVKFIYDRNFEKYNIGFIEKGLATISDLNLRKDKIHWLDLRGYDTGWFADPFIVDYDDNVIRVLAEEYVYACHKGRISALSIDRSSFALIDCSPILENSTHFSFPAPIFDGDKLYIYPENYQSGKLCLYELDKKTLKVVDERVIIDAPLADTQIAKISSEFYAFGTLAGKHGNLYDDTKTVSIYKASSLFGPYSHFQTIDNANRIERGAGQIFMLDGTLVRPVQKCEKSYGEAVLFMALDFDGVRFNERIIGFVEPKRLKKWGFGLHTFNTCDNLIVVDGIDYNWHYFSLWFKPSVRFLRNMLRQ